MNICDDLAPLNQDDVRTTLGRTGPEDQPWDYTFETAMFHYRSDIADGTLGIYVSIMAMIQSPYFYVICECRDCEHQACFLYLKESICTEEDLEEAAFEICQNYYFADDQNLKCDCE